MSEPHEPPAKGPMSSNDFLQAIRDASGKDVDPYHLDKIRGTDKTESVLGGIAGGIESEASGETPELVIADEIFDDVKRTAMNLTSLSSRQERNKWFSRLASHQAEAGKVEDALESLEGINLEETTASVEAYRAWKAVAIKLAQDGDVGRALQVAQREGEFSLRAEIEAEVAVVSNDPGILERLEQENESQRNFRQEIYNDICKAYLRLGDTYNVGRLLHHLDASQQIPLEIGMAMQGDQAHQYAKQAFEHLGAGLLDERETAANGLQLAALHVKLGNDVMADTTLTNFVDPAKANREIIADDDFILEYARRGDLDIARELVPVYITNAFRTDAYLDLYKITGDRADLQSARDACVIERHWGEVYKVTGDSADLDQMRAVANGWVADTSTFALALVEVAITSGNLDDIELAKASLKNIDSFETKKSKALDLAVGIYKHYGGQHA